METGQMVFYSGWLLENSLVYCVEYAFMARMLRLQKRNGWRMACYLCLQCALTLCVFSFVPPVPLRELLHMGAACIFFLTICKKECGCQKQIEAGGRALAVITAVAILFAVSSFVQALSVTVLRQLAANLKTAHPAAVCVAPVMLLSAGLLSALLRLTARRWQRVCGMVKMSGRQELFEWRALFRRWGCLGKTGFSGRRTVRKEGYISGSCFLLFPCAFAVWTVRFGLGLDHSRLQSVRAPFTTGAPVWAFVCLAGAAAAFFAVLELAAGSFLADKMPASTEIISDGGKGKPIPFLSEPDVDIARVCAMLAEAQRCNARYRSFQHDIDNHLLVLSGLLHEKCYHEMRRYLPGILAASRALYPARVTGNPALDVLLREKVGRARQQGIAVSLSVSLPVSTGIDDTELCTVFANALDNAVFAVLKLPPEERRLDISAGMKRGFLLLEVTNSCLPDTVAKPGTGLANIADIARKYQGALNYQNDSGTFRLTVLLCAAHPGFEEL